MKAKLDSLDLLKSGTIVAQIGDTIRLLPFDDDEDFVFRVKVNFEDEASKAVNLTFLPGSKECVFEVNSPFWDRFEMANATPMEFALSDDQKLIYLVNIAISAIGPKERYTLVIHYTFLSRERS